MKVSAFFPFYFIWYTFISLTESIPFPTTDGVIIKPDLTRVLRIFSLPLMLKYLQRKLLRQKKKKKARFLILFYSSYFLLGQQLIRSQTRKLDSFSLKITIKLSYHKLLWNYMNPHTLSIMKKLYLYYIAKNSFAFSCKTHWRFTPSAEMFSHKRVPKSVQECIPINNRSIFVCSHEADTS